MVSDLDPAIGIGGDKAVQGGKHQDSAKGKNEEARE
jgi:hypothetical protein